MERSELAGRFGRATAATLLGAALVACSTGATSTPLSTSTVPSSTEGALGLDVDVGGGRTIHIECAGPADSGRPTVVFENGSGPSLSTWSSVIDDLKATDRACAYDRAGIGRSDAVSGPRTTRDQVVDLAAVLQAADVTGPIVIVGHSLGAWNAIVYTADHPEQVAGAVLIDMLPPGLDGRWLAELPPETPGEPAHIKEARDSFTTFPTDPSQNPENVRIGDSEAQVLAAPGFGARPTEILWATETDATVWPGFAPDLADRLNAVFEELRGDVEAMADDPNVTRVDAGHAIHEERPQVVIEAIRRVLAAVDAGPAS